jgi:hypothetical protein
MRKKSSLRRQELISGRSLGNQTAVIRKNARRHGISSRTKLSPHTSHPLSAELVGVAGFEPAASSSRSQRAMWPTTAFTLSDLPCTVRGRPLASAGVCGGCYSVGYSPVRGAVAVAMDLIPLATDRPGDALCRAVARRMSCSAARHGSFRRRSGDAPCPAVLGCFPCWLQMQGFHPTVCGLPGASEWPKGHCSVYA